jgi:hypothetical protein
MADRYWVGGAGTWDTSSTANWSATSGGAAGASAPTSSDNVFFNQASTYTVQASGGNCQNITVNAGTVTFNTFSPGSSYFTATGNISITAAATIFTAPTNSYGVIGHQPSSGTPTVAFGSSGTNTQKVYFISNVSGPTSYTFCTGATQTFHNLVLSVNCPFTCAGSTITIDNQERTTSGAQDYIQINATTFSVAGTTINMGSATANTNPYADYQLFGSAAAEPTVSGLNVVQVRAYDAFLFRTQWFDTVNNVSKPFRYGNLTFKGTNLINQNTVEGVYRCNVFTATDTKINFYTTYANTSFQKTFDGAFTLNGSTVAFDNSLSALFSSTTTLTTGTGGTAGSSLSSFDVPTYTFTGAFSMTGGTSSGSALDINFATVNLSSTLTGTAPTGIQNTISGVSSWTVAGNTNLTNTNLLPDSGWTQAGASTFTITSSPTSNITSSINVGNPFTMGTGTATITSTNSTFRNGFTSGGLVNVSGAATSTGVFFESYSGSVSFVAATLATWTDVYVDLSFFGTSYSDLTITGAGGFTLAGTTKNSGLTVAKLAVTGPTTLNAASGQVIRVDSIPAGGGAFTANGVSGGGTIFSIVGSAIATSVFSSTLSTTNVGIDFTCTNLTFTGAVTITNPSSISVSGTTTTISNALSISSTNLIDGIDGIFGSPKFVFYGDTLTTSSTATNWTFTNARIYFQFNNAGTITNPVILADNGGLYWAASNLTLNSALTSSGVSKWNILLLKSYGATLTLKGAVTLVNCQLAATNIVVDGGATRNFAYSLSTPICNNTTVNTTEYYGSSIAQNYPEICVDSFTLSATGGTFSIAGGGSAIFRTLVRPYRAYAAADPTTSSCTLTLPALTPTLTDVDFWRVTVAGAVTKPLTGTRLGNVGTITNITTATPKSVYWVGGAGAWDAAKWATSSGGTGLTTNYPLPQDTIIFDSNSGTGNFTYPASIRAGNIDIQSVPSGTSAVYCNSTNSTTSLSYLWVSGNINGPVSSPVGSFILGNTSTYTYNSFSVGQLQTIVIADGSSGATHELKPINIQFMPYGSLQFATLGTTTISGSITDPVYLINNYCSDAYTINITAAQIGSSSFDYSNSTAIIAIGTPDGLAGSGTVNYGACNIYTYRFYPSQLTSNTAYSVFINQLNATTSTTLGNINFTQGTTGNTIYGMAVFTVSCLSINIVSKSNSSLTGILFTGVPNISTYACTVTYSGSITSSFLTKNGSAGSLTKLGGGTVNLPGVGVVRMNASPANTWYTTGGVFSSTGWNAGTAPNSKGGFLLFQ